MTHRIVQGDDISLTITVQEDGVAVDISSASLVTVALIHAQTLQLSGVASSGASGADFANGVIVILFTAAQTATLTANNELFVEVEVDNSGISSWVKNDFGSHAQSIRVHASLL